MAIDHPTDALPPGFRLGPYEILRVLGRGGFGVTYAARVLGRSGEMVAVKELFPRGLCVRRRDATVEAAKGCDVRDLEATVAMFHQEAKIICTIHHPNLVRGIEWIEKNGTGYLVMDYVSGKSLREHLRSTGGSYRVGPTTMAQLSRGMLSGLECLHAHGIVHGDLKPDNVFLGMGFEPIIIDLGSARASAGLSDHIPGTYSHHYSAIEQIEPRYGPVGPWTDIYQMSAVLYRCLSGGKLPDAADRVADRVDSIVRLMEMGGLDAYPPAFREAIDAGLGRFPDDRPRSVKDWRRLLDPALESISPSPKHLPRPQQTPNKVPEMLVARGADSSQTAGPDPLAIVGLGLLIVVGFIGLLLLAGC